MGGGGPAAGRVTAARSVLHCHVILNAFEGELALTEVSNVLRLISARLGSVGGFPLSLEPRDLLQMSKRQPLCEGEMLL